MVITLAPIPTGDTSRAESNVLASMNGFNITTADLQKTIQSRFRNSPQVDQAKIIPAIAGNLLDTMILQRAVIVQARKMGIEVSDKELGEALQSFPWLMQDGAFIGISRYQDAVLQQTGMSVVDFEAELRSRLLEDKIRSVVTDGAQVSPQEVREEFQHRNTKAKIDYVLFDPSQYIKAVEVTPQALDAYFKKDPQHYQIPEERKVRYVVISPDDVRGRVKVADEEARQYYTQHLSEYRIPDRVKVAHILFKTTGKNPTEIADIQKKAEDVLKQIKGGADFGEMAKKDSDDGSAPKGGELGWLVRGQTVKEFEDKAFAMKPGEVSDLVKTVYGIHIIKLEDKQTAHLQTFDEVKGSIIATSKNSESPMLKKSWRMTWSLNSSPSLTNLKDWRDKQGCSPRLPRSSILVRLLPTWAAETRLKTWPSNSTRAKSGHRSVFRRDRRLSKWPTSFRSMYRLWTKCAHASKKSTAHSNPGCLPRKKPSSLPPR